MWYTDVCKKAELIDYTSVKGLFIYRPYGYAIWENIQAVLDRMFKETGHENVYMPVLIPESLLQKEKDHVEGFAPECAWVTMGGAEGWRSCASGPPPRPCFATTLRISFTPWRDLPVKYNQWCSVLRWGRPAAPSCATGSFCGRRATPSTPLPRRPFRRPRTSWNATPASARSTWPCRWSGVKTEKEKFSGAERTYAIECMMHDRKALQAGTSHYFGDGFAKAFDIHFTDKNNQQATPFETSWGLSTRLIGGIIMTHGDNNGLVLPPRSPPSRSSSFPWRSTSPASWRR